MSAELLKPIYSSRCDDPAAGDAVDRFVVGLAERIDLLQDAEVDGDFARLAELAEGLVVEADSSGFGALAGVAQALESACRGDDPKAAREKLLELTEIAQRIRLGHKGAA
jgi:HPt (histidine-containing phosphotransfer) domain-containing protein